MDNILQKQFSISSTKTINEQEMSIVGVGSKEVLDRDGEIIKASAWNLDNFKKNPILLLSHDYSRPPVGKILWIKTEGDSLIFKARFAKTQTGNELFSLYRDGYMNSFSVGFLPKEYDEPNEDQKSIGARRIYNSVELLEISCVSVPSCPEALMERYYNGEIKTKDVSNAIQQIVSILSPDQKDADSNTDNVGKDGDGLQTKGEEQKGSEAEKEPREQLPSATEGKKEDVPETKSEISEPEAKGTVEEEECNCIECNPESGDEKASCRRKPKKDEEGEDEKGCDEEVVKETEIVNKPEVTENTIRIPVDRGDHNGHTMRTITLSSSQGITALYCVNDKKILTYIFDKDKWSMEEAKDWVDRHKSLFSAETKISVDDFMISPISPPPLKLLHATISDFQSFGYISIEDAMDFFDSKGMNFEIELDETIFEIDQWVQYSLKILEIIQENESLRDRYSEDLNKMLSFLKQEKITDKEDIVAVNLGLGTVEEKTLSEADAIIPTDNNDITEVGTGNDPVVKSELSKFFEDLKAISPNKKDEEKQEQPNMIDVESDEFAEAVKVCLTEILNAQQKDFDILSLFQEEIKKAKGEVD